MYICRYIYLLASIYDFRTSDVKKINIEVKGKIYLKRYQRYIHIYIYIYIYLFI